MRYIFFLLACTSSLAIMAQSSKKEQETEVLKTVVTAKRFVFHAQSAIPTGGMSIQQLSRGYDLFLTPDSIICQLPYYGRLYQAPLNAQDEGIKFTSTSFDYTSKDRKKGGWEIKMKTKDVRNSPQLFLTIYTNSSASLRITCSDRQSISYEGIIEAPKPE